MTKKYFVNESILFNLDSMLTHAYNIRNDFRDGERTAPLQIAGRTLKDEFDAQDFIDYLDGLYDKAFSRKVDGKTYGELKKIQFERQAIRYNCCLAAGMSERDAGYAFTD